MSLITPENFFLLFMGLIFSALFLLPYVLVMQFLMPKNILDRYFKPPYFREFEVALFTGIPYSPLRTVMFMGVIVFPKLGKKRNLTAISELVPKWYEIASKVFICWVIILAVSLPTILIGLFLFDSLTR